MHQFKVTQIVKLSDSQSNRLKSATKNKTGVILRLPSNMIGSSNGETNFPYNGWLSRQAANVCKAFAKNSSANINLQILKILK